MITGLRDAMISHFNTFKRKNNIMPSIVVIYRDGVSDGQFNEVGCGITSMNDTKLYNIIYLCIICYFPSLLGLECKCSDICHLLQFH